MGSTWDVQIKVAKGVLILNSIIAGIGYFIFNPWTPFITGLLFGTIIALLNFRLLSLTLEKAVYMRPEKAQIYATSRYFIRFLLYGAVDIEGEDFSDTAEMDVKYTCHVEYTGDAVVITGSVEGTVNEYEITDMDWEYTIPCE